MNTVTPAQSHAEATPTRSLPTDKILERLDAHIAQHWVTQQLILFLQKMTKMHSASTLEMGGGSPQSCYFSKIDGFHGIHGTHANAATVFGA